MKHTERGGIPGPSLKLDVDWQGQPHIMVTMVKGGRGGGNKKSAAKTAKTNFRRSKVTIPGATSRTNDPQAELTSLMTSQQEEYRYR